MALNGKQKQFLRAAAHKLKPVISVGNGGVSESVMAEFVTTIAHHELIKAKIGAGDRLERDKLITALAQRCGAELVQVIGRTAVFYRRAETPKLVLP